MSNLFDIEQEDLAGEEFEMSSQNHGLVQLRIGAQLLGLGNQYNAATEISLDMSSKERQEILDKHHVKAEQELKPDVVLYHAKDFGFITPSYGEDKIRVDKVPLLCVEVLSPNQGSYEILKKFRTYFEIGVKSCWYVDPGLMLVRVYSSSLDSHQSFEKGEIVDEGLGIKIPLNKIFF
jgi:Uma2 family endonuclease